MIQYVTGSVNVLTESKHPEERIHEQKTVVATIGLIYYILFVKAKLSLYGMILYVMNFLQKVVRFRMILLYVREAYNMQ